ncbi:hypothetical protein GF420_13305 [candidate division GN15 bacterium]|nr:hypothetical protein [candidate division GN15 bacterium]
MMTYFEVRQRLTNLTEFRSLFREYSQFTNRETNVAAKAVRQKMEPLAAMTVDSLRRVDLGSMVTRDAQTRGGRKIRINLIKAIFRDHVVRNFDVRDSEVLSLLDRGISSYQTRLWRQQLNLFNPLFWIYQIGVFLAYLPILIFRAAGYDTDKVTDLTSMRLLRLALQVAFFAALIKWSGLIDLIRFDILAL